MDFDKLIDKRMANETNILTDRVRFSCQVDKM